MIRNRLTTVLLTATIFLAFAPLSRAANDCKPIPPDEFVRFCSKLNLRDYRVDGERVLFKSPGGAEITTTYQNGAIVMQAPCQKANRAALAKWKKFNCYKYYQIGDDRLIVSSFYVGKKFDGEKFARWLKRTPIDFDEYAKLPKESAKARSSRSSRSRTNVRVERIIERRTVVVPPPPNYVPLRFGPVPIFVVRVVAVYVVRDYPWPWPPYPFDDDIYWADDDDLLPLCDEYNEYEYDPAAFDLDDYDDSNNPNDDNPAPVGNFGGDEPATGDFNGDDNEPAIGDFNGDEPATGDFNGGDEPATGDFNGGDEPATGVFGGGDE